MDLLTAQLDEYNKHGVPKLANVHLQCDVTVSEEGTIFSATLFLLFCLLPSLETRDSESRGFPMIRD